MSSLAGFKIVILFLGKIDFGPFQPSRSTFKVDFLNIKANFKKSLVTFLREVVINVLLNFEFLSLLAYGGGASRSAS